MIILNVFRPVLSPDWKSSFFLRAINGKKLAKKQILALLKKARLNLSIAYD